MTSVGKEIGSHGFDWLKSGSCPVLLVSIAQKLKVPHLTLSVARNVHNSIKTLASA
jgi:hypothetical protein